MEDTGYSVILHVWYTTVGSSSEIPDKKASSVGHTALELRNHKNNTSQYFSLRPVNAWMVNPFTFFLPVQGCNLNSIEEDIAIEGINATDSFSKQIKKETFLRMEEAGNFQIDNINNGNIKYHLFPKFSIFLFLNRCHHTRQHHRQCPFSEIPIESAIQDSISLKTPESSHCALNSSEILTAGGFQIQKTMYPWIITPTEVAQQFEKQIH